MKRRKGSRKKPLFSVGLFFVVLFFCGFVKDHSREIMRNDGAVSVNISLTGSLQNPVWSADGKSLLFTRFRGGYNREPADLFIIDLQDNSVRILVSDGSGNINLPGSAWNGTTHKIVFASTRDPHDEIYVIDENGTTGEEMQITSRDNHVAYEPSFSPAGDWIVFESHVLDVEDNGVIYKCKTTGDKPYQMLTVVNEDCRQPNWSPAGNLILYQKFSGGQWDIWVMKADGTNHRQVTGGWGDKTDASFSPGGQWIVYSSNQGGEAYANLYIIPVNGGQSRKITNHKTGYDGAPSWSPDGSQVAFESCEGEPDGSTGTGIWIIRFDSQSPFISLDRNRLNFGFTSGTSAPVSQMFRVSNAGSGTLNWAISKNESWIECTPGSGSGTGMVTVTVAPSALSVGQYTRTITVSSSDAANSPQMVILYVRVYPPTFTGAPFGEFSTPADGSTVASSIPVTGWVLDDVGVESVKIYRRDGSGGIYIGDAVFVEGARPDVERAYPGYPFNYKAGWGYMMLSNFFPNSGNGEFTIYAEAVDKEGHQTNLGSKTITCDNAHAVKPFGAIDTPAQGGVASGKKYIVWGWVLTPQPNHIYENGSTIDVYVDNVKLGHPVYNIYRNDIASLFPGYANSNGAVGYFYLDTTKYENGVHTIHWAVVDSGGNMDGIGSRFFIILNSN